MISGLTQPIRFALGLVILTSLAWAGPRVAVSVTTDKDAELWQSVLTAGLNHAAPDAEIVERAELARLWQERETSALASGNGGISLLVNVDRYLHFRHAAGERWIVTLIDAASGRDLGSLAVDAGELEAAPHLSAAAASLLNTPAPTASNDKVRVAVVETAPSAENPKLLTLAAGLRDALSNDGLVVLDRTLTQELAVEHNDGARGFRATTTTGVLLGLDYRIELSSPQARLVRVGDGTLLGTIPFGNDHSTDINLLRSWALPLMGRPAATETTYLPQVEIEALEPYYRGIARYDSGEYEMAVVEFTRAYGINGRFREAYEWAARSYDALEMTPVAASIRRYLGTEFLENLPAATGRVSPVDGIGFLGVEANESLATVALDLSAATSSVLAARPDIRLVLPDQLQRLRREYDWMSIENAEPGHDITNAPGRFTRFALSGMLSRDDNGALSIRWTLRDSLGLRPPTVRSLGLTNDRTDNNQRLGEWLKTWPTVSDLIGQDNGESSPRASSITDSAEAIAGKLRSAAPSEIEYLRLRLMQAGPEFPIASARGPGKQDEPLASFIDGGRREYLIGHLPAGNTQRRWLELIRALNYRDPYKGAALFYGHSLDSLSEFRRIANERDDDGPGLLARYYSAFYAQSERPPADTVEACRQLSEDMKAQPDLIPDISEKLTKVIKALSELAEIADGQHDTSSIIAAKDFIVPFEAGDLVWSEEGRLQLETKRYRILGNPFVGLEGDDLVRNARAQLTLNAYLESERYCELEWLSAFPRTRTVTNRIVRALTSIGQADGPQYQPDPDSRTATEEHWMACINYAIDNIEYEFAKVTDYTGLRLTQYMAMGLLASISNISLCEVIDEQQSDAIRQRVLVAFENAKSVKPVTSYNPNTMELVDLTRDTISRHQADLLDNEPLWIPDAKVIKERLLQRESGFIAKNGKAANPYSWWWLALRWETEKAFSAVDRAALLSRCTGLVLDAWSDTPNFKQAAQYFDLALALVHGREYRDAERILTHLVALPVDDRTDRERRELVANSLFRLAQIQHVADRLPEALETAARGLDLCASDQLNYYTDSHDYMHNEADLPARFSRLIVELRFDPSRANLPERVSHVVVPTNNADNPRLCVYYRPPPPVTSNTKQPRPRVLLLAPVTNQDPLEMLDADSPWTRFADEHNLVLVSPRFVTSDYAFRYDHAFTHQRYAQVWSGPAVLRAIDLLGRDLRLDTDKVLIHGQASGGGFASHFAAWRPDRVEAVSIINSNWGVSRMMEKGLQPPEALRAIRYWVAANPRDDTAMPRARRRYIYQVDFTARLRHAGVSVEWSDWPNPNHTPSPEMEAAARAFLARQLSK